MDQLPKADEQIQNGIEENDKLITETEVPKKSFFSTGNLILIYVIVGVGAGIAFILGIIYLATSDNDEVGEPLETEEREELITELIKNNPDGIMDDIIPDDIISDNVGGTGQLSQDTEVTFEDQSPIQTPSENAGNAPIPLPLVDENGNIEPLRVADLASPDLDEYNYRYTESEYNPGPALDRCESFNWRSDSSYTNEYYEFFAEDRSYYKYVRFDEDNNLTSYYLGKYGSDINESYSYLGGDYGVQYLYAIYPFRNQIDLYPNSYPSSYVNSYPASYSGSVYGASDAVMSPGRIDLNGMRMLLKLNHILQ